MIEDEQTTYAAEATPTSDDGQAEAQATPAPATAQAAPESEHDRRIAELEATLAELERQIAHERDAATDYMNRWQRAQADFSNFKRRSQQEQEQREAQIAGSVVATLLPALDSFERAFATLPPTLRGFSWIDGIALVHLQFHNALAAHGIQPVAAEPGQAFDPLLHESIGAVETADHPEGHIAVVVQRGYEAKGLLLRPALVQIARTPQVGPTASATNTSEAGAATAPAADGGEAPGA
ncbi:MAG: nucleotide exchange factor GrpE [Ktedonobacterales bacterium]